MKGLDREDRPSPGPDPPEAVFFYSRSRSGERPDRHLAGYARILQADAYAGFGNLYQARRLAEAACWSHGWLNFLPAVGAARGTTLMR